MELRDLKYFREIAKSGSFSLAAENLYVSQPALSKAMKKLEEELGFPLFEKRGAYKTLTGDGEVFLNHVQAILGSEQRMNDWLNLTRRKYDCQVRVGVIPYYLTPWTSDCFYKFQRKNPNVKLSVSESPDKWIEKRLLSGELDVGITERKLTDKNLRLLGGFSDSIDVGYSRASPLWEKKNVRFSDLKDETFHMITSDSPLKNNIIQQAAKAGFQPKIGYMGSQVGAVLAHLMESGGICLLNRPILQCNIALSPIFERELRQMPMTPQLSCYCWVYTKNTQLSPQVENFTSHLCWELEMDLQHRIV